MEEIVIMLILLKKNMLNEQKFWLYFQYKEMPMVIKILLFRVFYL